MIHHYCQSMVEDDSFSFFCVSIRDNFGDRNVSSPKFRRWIVSIGKRLKFNPLTDKTRDLTNLYEKPFENIVRTGEDAGNQHFLLFPQCFLPFPKQISIFDSHSNCRLQC